MEIAPELLHALRSIEPTGSPLSSLDDAVGTALIEQRLVKLISDGKGGTLIVSGLGAKALLGADPAPADPAPADPAPADPAPTPDAPGDPEASTVPLSVPSIPDAGGWDEDVPPEPPASDDKAADAEG